MKFILETESLGACTYTWKQLGFEVGVEYSGHTLKKAMGTIDYHKYIAYRQGWINEKIAKNCLNWVTTILQKYPHLEDWHRICLSDKVHFGYNT